MTQAVTHVLVTIILFSLFRDFCVRDKKKFPLHYVLIGGIASLMPDIDVAAYYILSFFGFTMQQVHRTFSHDIFVVLLFVILGLIFYRFNTKELGRHHLKLHNVFFVIAFGVFMHLFLDALVAGVIMPFYPFSHYTIGVYLVNILPEAWRGSIIPSLDAVLFVLWLVYMELKHKISDFI
jgi:membrane-bound metal-dependent hydrolase YbcI (DUF457 family)